MRNRVTEDVLGDLVSRAKAGDAAARGRLLLAVAPLIRAAARRALAGRRCGVTQDDLAQDGTLVALRAVDMFAPGGTPFAAYLWHALRRALRRLVEASPAWVPLDGEGDFPGPPGPTPDWPRDGGPDLADALAGLPADRRAVVEMYFGLGDGPPMTFEQVARRRGLGLKSVRRLYRDALSRLRSRLC